MNSVEQRARCDERIARRVRSALKGNRFARWKAGDTAETWCWHDRWEMDLIHLPRTENPREEEN